MTRHCTVAIVVLLLAIAANGVSGQDLAVSLSGTVSSIDGARLPRATITLVDQSSDRRQTASSDGVGAFVVDGVTPGTYTVVVTFPGFSTAVLDNIVVGGGRAELAITLEPERLTETITVAGALPRDSVEVTELRESAARDVGELLAETTGLWKLRKGAIANDVVLRGLQSRDLNVLIDGERLYGACPNRMDPPAFHVDFSEVERVDVGKGPFDVRYQGGLGGIVNIVTRRPEAGWNGSTSVALGSNGAVNPSATLSFGGPRLSWLGGASYRRADPYTDGRGQVMTAAANYRAAALRSDAFRATTAWTRASWKPGARHEIEASYTRQQTDHVLYPYLMMDGVWDNADRLSIEYATSMPARRVSGLKAQGYWSRVHHWMSDAYRQSSAAAERGYSMGSDAATSTAGGRVEATLAAATLGAEIYRRNWNSASMLAGIGGYATQHSIPDVNIESIGMFVEHARAIGTRLSLDIGGRVDRLAARADAAKADLGLYAAYHGVMSTTRRTILPTGRAKAAYQLSPVLGLAVALGHSARVPEPNEQFLALRRMGTDWVGNPALDPARNTGVDASLTLRLPRLTVSANTYVSDIHDYIAVYGVRRQAMVPNVMNVNARSYANVDARLRGFEANGSLTVRSPFTLSGDLSYVRGTMTPRPEVGINGTDLAETPPLRARLRVRVDDGRSFAEVEGVASAAQSHVDETLGEAMTPSHAIVNASAGLRRGQLAVTAGVGNLLDAYYVEHLSFQRDPFRSGIRLAEPGRNFFTNVQWRF
jgi:iron complex outermembrane receptor protein